MDVAALVRARVSHRTYDGRELDEATAAAVEGRLAALPPGPFGTPVRVRLVRVFDAEREGEKLGTYGFISGARSFLVGLVGAGAQACEDFGYVFEAAVLAATELGLGTCWIGGTLRRGAFARAGGAAADESVAAVSPIGWPRPRRGVVDRVVRWAAGSRVRRPAAELFFDEEPGRPLAADPALAGLLELVRLAPSASNRQPWRIVRRDGRLHFLLARTAGYRRLTEIDLQRVDLGIAAAHFGLGAAAAGRPGRFILGEAPALPGLEPEFTWDPRA